jgi:hypothetical protein
MERVAAVRLGGSVALRARWFGCATRSVFRLRLCRAVFRLRYARGGSVALRARWFGCGFAARFFGFTVFRFYGFTELLNYGNTETLCRFAATV